ncbi:MAG: hypothetical protein ACXVRJ_07590 [Gaiellaceae bacterium]
MITGELRDFAVDTEAYITLPPGFKRFQTERYSLLLGPPAGFTSVQRVRCAPDELPEMLAEVRELVAENGHENTVWWLSDEPLWESLRALGLEDDHEAPELTAMIALEPPAPGPADVVARPVEPLEEYTDACELNWEVFELPEHVRESLRATLAERFEADHASRAALRFLAWVDGRPAASGIGVYCPLGGHLASGATLPWARGRGAYRALVRARWDEAVCRGRPVLVVPGGEMSSPILRRLGFEEVCVLRRVRDRA